MLTYEDVQRLCEPFAAEDHEWLNKNAYLREWAICERIEEIDASWEFSVQSITREQNEGAPTITVAATLTIQGVSRSNTGMAFVVNRKDGGGEANEAEKSATTDALKRCARLFGIGRYLLKLGSVSNEAQLRAWLERNYPQNGAYRQNAPTAQQDSNGAVYPAEQYEPAQDEPQELKDLTGQFAAGFDYGAFYKAIKHHFKNTIHRNNLLVAMWNAGDLYPTISTADAITAVEVNRAAK
jgi:hypothetical protein